MNRWIASVGVLILAKVTFAQEQVIPQGYLVERYTPLWEKSPFTLSSVSAEQVVPAGFADGLALTGILKMDDDVYVSVMNKNTKERLMLSGKQEEQGILVQKLDLAGNDPDKVSVTLKKGNEVSVLRYDMNYLKQMAAVSGATPSMPQPVSTPAMVLPNNGITPSASTPRVAPPLPNKPPVQRRIIIPSQPPKPPTS